MGIAKLGNLRFYAVSFMRDFQGFRHDFWSIFSSNQCSFSKEEGENVIPWWLDHRESRPVPLSWGEPRQSFLMGVSGLPGSTI